MWMGISARFSVNSDAIPGEYAMNPVPLYLFTPYGVKFREIERRPIMENLRNVFIQVMEKPERKVIIRGEKKPQTISHIVRK